MVLSRSALPTSFVLETRPEPTASMPPAVSPQPRVNATIPLRRTRRTVGAGWFGVPVPSFSLEIAEELGEVVVGGKSYGGDSSHARHDDYSEHQCLLVQGLFGLTPNSGQQQ